jgi:hypothetical protein
MDALKFIEERSRMCKLFSPGCEGCRIDEAKPVMSECVLWMIENPEKAVEIVERWSQEHPPKTRQDVFLEQWPNAVIYEDGVLDIAPCRVDRPATGRCDGTTCGDCRREFWMQEVE